MDNLNGKKIFVLYPDEKLRNIFYGALRNEFSIYYIYDYEKIRALIEYYPGSVIVYNLIDNDLDWIPDEVNGEFKELPGDVLPKTIVVYDNEKPPFGICSRSVHYQGNEDDLRAELNQIFTEYGAKGRRNFVRYGGSGDNIASIQLIAAEGKYIGIVHDISASGLSCSIIQAGDIPVGDKLSVRLGLSGKTITIDAVKLLQRNFDENIVHVLKFVDPMPEGCRDELLHFIYSSLDSKMQEFIKNLSN